MREIREPNQFNRLPWCRRAIAALRCRFGGALAPALALFLSLRACSWRDMAGLDTSLAPPCWFDRDMLR
jgi:hypothetical protein